MVKVWGLCIRAVWYLTDQLMIDKLTWWYLDIFCWLQQDYAHSEDYPLRRYGRAAGVEPCIHTTINPNRTSYSVHLESVSKRLARLARCEIFWQPTHMIPIYQHIYQRCLRISSCFMFFTYIWTKDMNPNRRVVNTFDTFCVIEAAQEHFTSEIKKVHFFAKVRCEIHSVYMGVSVNGGTPKSSILTGFSILNHPFWGTPNFWKPPYKLYKRLLYYLHLLYTSTNKTCDV